MSKGEVYGKVCVDVPRLSNPSQSIGGRFDFKMPAGELLKLDIEERDETRYAGTMIEHTRGYAQSSYPHIGFHPSPLCLASVIPRQAF